MHAQLDLQYYTFYMIFDRVQSWAVFKYICVFINAFIYMYLNSFWCISIH